MVFEVYANSSEGELVLISESSSVLANAISYDSLNGIIVDTSFTELAGDHTIAMKAYLIDYPAIQSSMIQTTIRFEFCEVLDVITSEIETVEVPLTGNIEADFYEWVVVGSEPCKYVWSYKAFLGEQEIGNTELASSLKFNPQLRKFTISSNNSGYTYTIRLEGTLSD